MDARLTYALKWAAVACLNGVQQLGELSLPRLVHGLGAVRKVVSTHVQDDSVWDLATPTEGGIKGSASIANQIMRG